MDAKELKANLEAQFPVNATCWSQATDEVRDISRSAREIVGLDETWAIDFGVLHTPAEWNYVGIRSIIGFYQMMSKPMQLSFIENWKHIIG